MSLLTVAKFGGTSVADYEAMTRCAEIVINNPAVKLVVVSASAGVTNHLVKLASAKLENAERDGILRDIRQIEISIVEKLGKPESVYENLEFLLRELTEVSCHCDLANSHLLQNKLLAFGEKMSSLLFTEVLRQRGGKAINFDACKVIKTNSNPAKAEPDIEKINRCVEAQLTPLIIDTICITQGFIGADDAGNTTILGRGGSDYSAALFAEALQADVLEIWTDVIGIYTTDPRITEKARPIPEISFDEAAEMATFGAKILHPATLIPAMRHNIRVFVGSSRSPKDGGTWILKTVEHKPVYRAIALRNDQVLVTVKSPKMLYATGFLAKVFAVLAKYEMSVDLITTSEISVALTIDNPADLGGEKINQQAMQELSEFCAVTVEKNLALISVVGNHMQGGRNASGKVFDALENFSPRMICQGASPHNICFLVEQDKAKSIVYELHDSLF